MGKTWGPPFGPSQIGVQTNVRILWGPGENVLKAALKAENLVSAFFEHTLKLGGKIIGPLFLLNRPKFPGPTQNLGAFKSGFSLPKWEVFLPVPLDPV